MVEACATCISFQYVRDSGVEVVNQPNRRKRGKTVKKILDNRLHLHEIIGFHLHDGELPIDACRMLFLLFVVSGIFF